MIKNERRGIQKVREKRKRDRQPQRQTDRQIGRQAGRLTESALKGNNPKKERNRDTQV